MMKTMTNYDEMYEFTQAFISHSSYRTLSVLLRLLHVHVHDDSVTTTISTNPNGNDSDNDDTTAPSLFTTGTRTTTNIIRYTFVAFLCPLIIVFQFFCIIIIIYIFLRYRY